MKSYRQDFLSIKMEGLPRSELFDIFFKALRISELTDMPVYVIFNKTESITVEKAFGLSNEQQAHILVDCAIKMIEISRSTANPVAIDTKSIDDVYKDFKSSIETLNKFASNINNKKNQ